MEIPEFRDSQLEKMQDVTFEPLALEQHIMIEFILIIPVVHFFSIAATKT